jgi:hypothetical protein
MHALVKHSRSHVLRGNESTVFGSPSGVREEIVAGALSKAEIEPHQRSGRFRYLSKNSNVPTIECFNSSPPNPCPAPTNSSTRPGTPAAVMASVNLVAWVGGTSGSLVP